MKTGNSSTWQHLGAPKKTRFIALDGAYHGNTLAASSLSGVEIFYEEARRRGAYLRPLGDTVYVCPPLVIEDPDLDALLAILEESVRATLA